MATLNRILRSLTALVAMLFLGCSATSLPPRLELATSGQHQGIPLRVAVRQQPRGSELVEILRATGVFTEVDIEPLVVRPDLTVEYHARHQSSNAAIPLATFLTLGLVPTFFDNLNSATLVFEGSTGGSFAANPSWRGRGVLGWMALPLSVSPGWAIGDPFKTHRFAAHLRAYLLEHRQQLVEIAGKHP